MKDNQWNRVPNIGKTSINMFKESLESGTYWVGASTRTCENPDLGIAMVSRGIFRVPSTIKGLVQYYNEGSYPKYYPFFLEEANLGSLHPYGININIGIPKIDNNDDVTSYKVVTVCKILGDTEKEVIDAFKCIHLNRDLIDLFTDDK